MRQKPNSLEHESSQDVTKEAIRIFDHLASELEAEGMTKNENLAQDVIRSIHRILGIGISSDLKKINLSEILSPDLTQEQKKLAAICLLRLLPCRNARWLTEGNLRPKVVQLIESQLGDDLYKDRKETENKQTHERVDRISAIVRETEESMDKAFDSFTSLNQAKTHRQRLMSVLNCRPGRIIFQPFLPNIVESLLSDFYNRIEEYRAAEDVHGIVETRLAVLEEAGRIRDLLIAYDTRIASSFREKIVNQALVLVDQDFSGNEAAQPAAVILKSKDKKYPLHITETKIQVGLLVENQGPGYAHDIRITILGDDNLSLQEENVEVGRLPPKASHLVEIPCIVTRKTEKADFFVEFKWKDFDGTIHDKQYEFSIAAQRVDVNWENLARSDPYSLEPVLSERDLVGRKDMLNRLIGAAQAVSVGSAIIYGQKRVGKTSIARALESNLRNQDYIVVYLEGGDYVEPNSTATICRLGDRLCKEIGYNEPRTSHVSSPSFNEALSPLVGYLNEVLRIIPEAKIFFILDEFDELPIDLYVRGAVGDAFFLTLRSISSRSRIGFVVVGSEKMAHVLDSQGDKLNKWKVFQVDYFTRDMDWTDYCDLVRRPVMDELEFTDNALIALHLSTSGNPYFTKLICQQILETALQRRDNCITEEEISRAIEDACRKIEKNSFQHFWEDGIFETGPLATEKSVRRRKILIALSDSLRNKGVAMEDDLAQHSICKDIHSLSADLSEFVARNVIIEKSSQGYEFKVPFFGHWLKRKGIHDLISTFSDLDAALQERQAEEAHRIKPDEVLTLTQKWKTYKGQAMTEDKVRAWLEQFGGPKEQRCMLKILEGLRFYGTDVIRFKMAEAHTIVRRDIVWQVASGKSGKEAKRSDVLISYLDGPAKSGAFLARLYADEARVYAENVVERKDIVNVLSKNPSIKALVFVDDFVGTGQSASDYLRDLDIEIGQLTKEQNIKCYFMATVAYLAGWKKVENIASNVQMDLQTHACEIIDETSQCFSDRTEVFQDKSDREYAKKLAILYGRQLVKRNPLGYGDLELTW